MKNRQKKFKNIVEYGYHCLIEPFMFFSVLILAQLHIFLCLVTQIQFLGDHKVVKNG